MENVYELTGDDLRSFLRAVGVPDHKLVLIYSLRVAIDGGFKASVNRGVWSPPLGEEYK